MTGTDSNTVERKSVVDDSRVRTVAAGQRLSENGALADYRGARGSVFSRACAAG